MLWWAPTFRPTKQAVVQALESEMLRQLATKQDLQQLKTELSMI